MAHRFTLYWTSLERFENCPQSFLWYRGWGNIDLGGGPGRRKPKPDERSEHHALIGTVTHGALEALYNEELWKDPKSLIERLREKIHKLFELEVKRRFIVWHEAPTRQEMLQMCEEWAVKYLQTLKHQSLLGSYARSEEELIAYINKYTPIGAKVDAVIRRGDTGVTLLDFKTSRRFKDRKGKPFFYTNPDQLRWYALCFRLAYGKLPDRLGFVYLRYPHGHIFGPEEPPSTGVSWVPFTVEDLRGLADRAIEARSQMDRENFPANPDPKGCRFCDYLSVCPQRQAQIAENRKKRGRRKAKPIQHGTPEGVVEVGLE